MVKGSTKNPVRQANWQKVGKLPIPPLFGEFR